MVMIYTIERCERSEIQQFIELHHYSHNTNGLMSTHCFKLTDGELLIGAALYGKMAMANAWRKYGEKEADVIELRRLVLIDDTKRNAESFFIGATLRYLRKHTTIKRVVSYADPNHGHIGIIYKASNFTHVGMSAPGRIIVYEDKQYHDKAIRTKYKGELKPFARRLRELLASGEAVYKKQLGKHIYIYNLRG